MDLGTQIPQKINLLPHALLQTLSFPSQPHAQSRAASLRCRAVPTAHERIKLSLLARQQRTASQVLTELRSKAMEKITKARSE